MNRITQCLLIMDQHPREGWCPGNHYFIIISKHREYIEDIQMFVMNMTFISSREVKKMYISFVPSAPMKYTFFTSLDEMQILQGEV